MIPNQILKSIEKDANILILNVQYVRSSKTKDGTYTPDYLYIVYRDFDDNKKKLQILSNPVTDIYITKPEFMNDFNTPREFLSFDKVDKHSVPFRNREKFIYQKLKENLLSDRDRIIKTAIDTAMELGKYSGKNEIHKWRQVYYSDYNLVDYVYTIANLYYNPLKVTLTKSYLDIECDVYNRPKSDLEIGKCPITAITMIYDYDYKLNTVYKPKVYTFLLRDHAKYTQQKDFEDNLDQFIEKAHKEFDDKYGVSDINILIYDSEEEMLYDLFKIQHLMKPDFTGIWNMSFDILYIQKRAEYLGIPAEALFCHPDFKNTYMSYYLDTKYQNDFKNRGDYFNCLSYTKYVDQMLAYAGRRKGDKDYGRNSLDNISHIEINAEKRKYSKPGVNVINAVYREYENFVLYNMNDVFLLLGIERKVEDIDDLFFKGYDSGTRIDKANKQTISLKNLWALSHLEQGYAIGNNLNVNNFGYDDDTVVTEVDDGYVETLKGALVGNPTNLNKTGALIFGNKRSDRLFLNCVDLDATAMYPSIKLVGNMTRSSQYGRIIIPDQISALEYSENKHLRGGEFIDDYETEDFIKLGIKWFSLKRTENYIQEFNTYDIMTKCKIKFKSDRRLTEFFKLWYSKISSILYIVYPDKKKLIKSFLSEVYIRDYRDVACILYNNYEDIEYETTLINMIDFIVKNRPALSESGVLFKRHEEGEISPGLYTIDKLLTKRKKLKGLEFKFKKAGDKSTARLYNLKQNRVKKYVNSDYGVTGAKSSFSYNFHLAQSVTSKGQTMISLAMTTFEDFISDTIQFYDMDEVLHFCNNIITESKTFIDENIIDKNKSIEDVIERLLRKCDNVDILSNDILRTYLNNVSQECLNRLYYKSNIEEFIEDNSLIKDLIRKFSINTTSFLDPNSPPANSIKYLNQLTDIILEYCQYNYPYYGRVDRLINMKRNCVIVIDTDSNIICIDKLLNIINQYTESLKPNQVYSNNTINKYKESKKIKMVNIIAYIITEVIDRVLLKFKHISNVIDHPFGVYKFKNEFYYEAFLLAIEGKKRYIGSIKIQEGNYLDPPKRDIKGFDFIKISSAPESIRNKIEDILFDYIVTENNDIAKALKEFIKLEEYIREALLGGSRELLSQAKVSTIDSYKDPMGTGQFKATVIWNTLYPEEEIILPNSVNLIKINIKSAKDIAKVALSDRAMFDKILELLQDPKMKTGITQIAIPLDLEEIPEWILDNMDIETMVNKYMVLVQPILQGLGIKSIYKKKSDMYLSNIITFN